jgi:hypothetical protein
MEILEFKEINPVTYKMRIRIDAETLAAEFEKVLSDLTGSTQIPGFRKGKASPKVVERYIGASEIWRMARDRAAHDALVKAMQMKKVVSVVEPDLRHEKYDGHGDYKFEAIIHTEAPSPQEILRRAMKPEPKTVFPEEHFPKGLEDQPGLSPESLLRGQPDPDHGHIIGGGFGGPIPDLPSAGGQEPILPKPGGVPGIEGQPNAAGEISSPPSGPSGLPGSPEFHPRLPAGLSGMLKRHDRTSPLTPDAEKAEAHGEPDEDIPDRLRKPKLGKPFKMKKEGK